MTRARWIVVLAVVLCYATAFLLTTFVYQFARVEGVSMAPTLVSQDRLLVNKWVYWFSSPKRGEIVMLRYPRNPQLTFVMRVIAQGGDTVRMEDGRVYVNDEAVQDDYVAAEFRGHSDLPERMIESGHYFVLGDRRNNSSDSREWGEVPERNVVGRVSVRWWPTVGAIR